MALRRAPLLAALLAAPGAAVAETTGDLQIWTAMLGTAELTPEAPGLSAGLDVHVRRGDASMVHLLRPGLGIRLAPWISAWVGYGRPRGARRGPEPGADAALSHSSRLTPGHSRR